MWKSISRMSLIGACLSLGTLFVVVLSGGCGDDENYIQIPESASNRFDVAMTAQVVAWPRETPIADAEFTIVQGSTGRSDADGYFSVEGLRRGNYQILVSAPGYYGTRWELEVDPEEKDQEWHIADTVYLMQPVGQAEILIIDRDDAQPLEGAPVTLQECSYPAGAEDQFLHQPFPVEFGASDATGRVIMEGLPDAMLDIEIGGLDLDGDGILEYLPTRLETELDESQTMNATVALDHGNPNSPLSLIATNLPQQNDQNILAKSLYFVFSDSMQTTGGAFSVTFSMDYSPYTEIAMIAHWTSPLRLELRPALELLNPDMRYDFDLRVSSIHGDMYHPVRRLYWVQPYDSGENSCEETVDDLAADGAEGLDYDDYRFTARWSAIPCADGYDLYLRDNRNHPSWIYYGFNPDDFEQGEVSEMIVLPHSFDRYQADSEWTPLAGIEVEVCVVPRNAVDQTPGPPHGTITLRDGTAPAIDFIDPSMLFANVLGEDQQRNMRVQFTEYLGTDSSTPRMEIREAGGDTNFTLDASNARWVWESGMRSGRFEVIVPAGSNPAGDEARVILDNAVDLSGNIAPGGLISEWTELPVQQTEWSFEYGPGGWSTDGELWEWGAPTTGPNDGHLGGYCWATGLGSFYTVNLDERLVSPYILLPEENPHVEFYAYDDFPASDYWEFIIEVDGYETALSQVTNDTDDWRLIGFALDSYAGRMVRLKFRFVSNYYSNGYGLYVDDVRVFQRD